MSVILTVPIEMGPSLRLISATAVDVHRAREQGSLNTFGCRSLPLPGHSK